MKEIEKDYFLHFLDRELLETQGIYNSLLEQAIIRDVRFILFHSIGDLILSASFLFESKYAYAIFNEFYPLFLSGKFTIAITYDSLKKMISTKQDQYKGNEKNFPNYFNDLWHIIEERGIILIPKREDTTLYIADGMLNEENYGAKMENRKCVPYIMEAVEYRDKRAITHHLFDSVYMKQGVSTNDQETINSLITELYIRSYLEYFDATIATGLSCGIFKYDYLSTNFPLSDVAFWIKLYKRIGIYQFVCTCNVSTIIAVLSSNIQYNFIQTVFSWLSYFENKKIGVKIIDKKFYRLINSIPQFAELQTGDINKTCILIELGKLRIYYRINILLKGDPVAC